MRLPLIPSPSCLSLFLPKMSLCKKEHSTDLLDLIPRPEMGNKWFYLPSHKQGCKNGPCLSD